MPLIDPFSTLGVPRDLVADFMAFFARCEFAMKASNYARKNNGVAAAAWQRLANEAAFWVQLPAEASAITTATAPDPLEHAIETLVSTPPPMQSFSDGWQAVPLRGAHRLAQAINAAVRVRHNLFHAGSDTPRSAPGRDEALVRAALAVLTAVVDHNTGDLKRAFNHG
jgi:hypothetical protein